MTEDDEGSRRDSFYGRRKGHPLRAGQSGALRRGLERLRIDLGQEAPSDLADLFDAAIDGVVLEIGFGGGEHLVHRAATEPGTGRIGVEPFVNGMAKAATAIETGGFGNIRLFDDDAAMLLDWLPPARLDAIDLLYPDPWPKTRHWKRRFVSAHNLDRLARVLKPCGLFRFASDIDTYVDWTLSHCRDHADFTWEAKEADDWRLPWPGWPGTRYERKAFAEGRRGTYLTFRRSSRDFDECQTSGTV